MKFVFKTLALAALLFPAFRASADTETRFFSVASGHSVTVDFDFAPSSYNQITGRDVVSVTMTKGTTFAVVTATGAKGTSQIEFKSPSGAATLVTIEILDRIDEILPTFESRIKPLGLRCAKMGDKIVVTGTIHNPSDWARFERICGLSAFKGLIDSDVEFGVDAATIDDLRAELVAAGISLAEKGSQPAEGQIAMTYSGNVLNFSGTVYSATDIDKLVRVLKGKPWLKIVGEPKDAAKSTIAQAVVGVSVDDALLELGVAFLKVSKTASKNLGAFTKDKDGNLIAGSALAIRGIWDGFYDFLTGKHSHNGADNFRIKASLDQTLTALAGNGVSRERQYGTMRFHANGDHDKTLHLGGKMTITPPPSGEGAAPAPQDYEYGFKITNRNSRRLGENMAEADVEIEFNGAPIFKNDGGAMVIDQQQKSLHPTVRVPLGQTVAVAGYESLMEDTTLPTGTPILRNIPIVNWFVSGQGEKLDDYTLLFLVSVRKVDVEEESPMVPNTAMKDISLDANTPNKERIEEERERTKKHRGCWEPLNWLAW